LTLRHYYATLLMPLITPLAIIDTCHYAITPLHWDITPYYWLYYYADIAISHY
jgi:hypothetical protein